MSALRALEQRERAQPVDHLGGLRVRERGEPHLDVAEHLGRPAARAARHDRAEALVGKHTDQHLDAGGRHALDEEVLDRRPGALEPVRDVLRGAADRGRAAQVEPHRPGLRLVHDARARRP